MQDLPGFRACKNEHADFVGQLGELDGTVTRHVLLKIVVIQPLQGARRHEVERIIGIAPNREFGVNTAPGVQCVAQADATNVPGQAVGDKPVEKCFGAGSGYPAFRECRHVEQACVARGIQHLLANCFEPPRATE